MAQWNSISNGRFLLKIRHVRINNGIRCDIQVEVWIPSLPDFIPKPNPSHSIHVSWVLELINQNPTQWNREKVIQAFNNETSNHVLKTHLPQVVANDSYIWTPRISGEFSTKSTYKVDQHQRSLDQKAIPFTMRSKAIDNNI